MPTPTSYATADDLEARWRPLSPDEYNRASVLVQDAAVLLAPYADAPAGALKIVTCNMVRRAMETQGDAFGIDGQIAQSDLWAPDLPTGELKLLPRDIKMLRVSHIGTIPMEDMSGGLVPEVIVSEDFPWDLPVPR